MLAGYGARLATRTDRLESNRMFARYFGPKDIGHAPTRVRTVAPGGALVLKDWASEPTTAYFTSHCTDRFLIRDRVKEIRDDELLELARPVFGEASARVTFRARPWHCNIGLLFHPTLSRDLP